MVNPMPLPERRPPRRRRGLDPRGRSVRTRAAGRPAAIPEPLVRRPGPRPPQGVAHTATRTVGAGRRVLDGVGDHVADRTAKLVGVDDAEEGRCGVHGQGHAAVARQRLHAAGSLAPRSRQHRPAAGARCRAADSALASSPIWPMTLPRALAAARARLELLGVRRAPPRRPSPGSATRAPWRAWPGRVPCRSRRGGAASPSGSAGPPSG